jgi:hypothetical protein
MLAPTEALAGPRPPPPHTTQAAATTAKPGAVEHLKMRVVKLYTFVVTHLYPPISHGAAPHRCRDATRPITLATVGAHADRPACSPLARHV